MSLGGRRPGAGRKKGTDALAIEEYRKLLVKKVLAQKGPIIDALINKALTGDVPALKEIQERLLGKVSDKLVLEDGGFIEALQEAKKLREKKS